MSNRFPGWHTLPGIEIAPLAAKARATGEPVKQFSYVWDSPGKNYVSTCGWTVDADGIVQPLGDGWKPITEDGMLTGFRGVKGGTVEELVQITTLIVPEGNPPWSPALTVRLPREQIGMGRISDSSVDGIDIEAGEHAAITVGYLGDDGSVTQVVWGITRESAASVIALIRERHGEPMTEVTTPPEHAVAFSEAAQAAMDAHGALIFTREDARP